MTSYLDRYHAGEHEQVWLRICFRWGGFPGLEPRIGAPDSTQHVAYLTEGLLPL